VRLERNRLALLYVHAISAILVCPLFLSYANATGLQLGSWRFANHIPGNPYTMAALLGFGGMILLCATISRSIKWAMLGLLLIMGWYTSTCLSFAVASFAFFGGAREGNPPGAYAVIVYAHMSAIMFVHLRTMRRMLRSHTNTWDQRSSERGDLQ
jgi:hypothetical protein